MKAIQHIHHISAIVGNPEENIKFYRDILNLKLIKKTVNYDDPSTYHLYFANDSVDNGTIITFFNWPNTHKGHIGNGQVERIAFRVPKGSLEVWAQHLEMNQIKTMTTQLFEYKTLEFKDTHGLPLALVEDNKVQRDQQAIIGFHGVTLLSSNPQETVKTLTTDMGLVKTNEDEDYIHVETQGEWRHHIIIKKQIADTNVRWGVGVVHHIAWSVSTNRAHLDWQAYMSNRGYHVTEVKDRSYFNAIYMKEHGGIIFEFATEGPGFRIDEPFEQLGQKLVLPSQYEDRREELLRLLPQIRV